MKYIITDNIRVANVENISSIKKRPFEYIGKTYRIHTAPGESNDTVVTNVAWAAQGIALLTVDQLGVYDSVLEKEILRIAAETSPKQIRDVQIYWRE